MRVMNIILTIQTACIIFVAAGIIIECIFGADLGFILITSGSLLFAVSTKIRNRQLKKRNFLTKTWKE